MIPVNTKETNVILGSEGYPQLPGEIYLEEINGEETVCIQTVWEMTDEELAEIIQNKKIYVSTVGQTIQPIAISSEPFSGYRLDPHFDPQSSN